MELEDLKDTINNRLDAGQVVDKNEAICSIDTSLCILNAIQLNIAETLSEKLEELTTDTENISGYLKRIAAALERPAETEKWPEDGHSEYERPGSFFLECQAPDGDNDRKETIECSHGFNLKFYNQSVQSMQGKVAFYEWAMKFCAAFRAWLAAARKGGQ